MGAKKKNETWEALEEVLKKAEKKKETITVIYGDNDGKEFVFSGVGKAATMASQVHRLIMEAMSGKAALIEQMFVRAIVVAMADVDLKSGGCITRMMENSKKTFQNTGKEELTGTDKYKNFNDL